MHSSITIEFGFGRWTSLLNRLLLLLVIAFALVLLVIRFDCDERLTTIYVQCVAIDDVDLIDLRLRVLMEGDYLIF